MSDASIGTGAIVSAAVRVLSMPLVFLWPAGTLWWPEAWGLIAVLTGYAALSAWFLARNDPELLRERMRPDTRQTDQEGWDRGLMVAMVFFGVAMLVVPGLDVVRFAWSEPLPVLAELLGFAGLICGFAAIFAVMGQNTFLSRVVKIDTDRGQTVITDGPYRLVRHPMYTAMVPLLLAVPLALGSTWGLVPSLGMVACLVVRTALEDRTLHEGLPGYPAYASQTRYRLLPGVW